MRTGRHDAPALGRGPGRSRDAGSNGAAGQVRHDAHMAKPPESTKTSLRQRLAARARERWPQLAGIIVRYHGEFAYVAGQLPDGTTLPLCRLRYTGSATSWGFAIYRASHDDYEKSVLPSGYPAGTPQEALDCACGLYLGDTTAWLDPPPPTNQRAHPLVVPSRAAGGYSCSHPAGEDRKASTVSRPAASSTRRASDARP